MMRLIVTLVLLCLIVGSMVSVNAQIAQTATGSVERATEKTPQQPQPSVPAINIHESPVTWKSGLALLIIVAAVVAAVVAAIAGRAAQGTGIPNLAPSFFFWLGMTYICLLFLAAAIYNIWFRPQPYLIAGILPIAVPWFGALGAVTISLEGVFLWNQQWDSKYNYWHIGRPLFGAVLGIVAFFLFVVLVTAAGTPPTFLGTSAVANVTGAAPSAKEFIIFYVVAFLVGYREETFRELIKRVTDLILKPGTQSPATPSVTFDVAGVTQLEVGLPSASANGNSQVTVGVKNTGNAPLIAPTVSVKPTPPAPTGTFGTNNDQVTGGGDLAPGQVRTIDVTFSPRQAGNFSGTLTVTGQNLPSPKTVRVSGTAN